MKKLLSIFILLVCIFCERSFSQGKVIDEVAGVVGNHVILRSDVDQQYLQYIQQGGEVNPDLRCEIMYQLLLHKLMVNQAELDSVQVNDGQVESELDRRIRFFITQIGSQEKLEAYYKKSVAEIKSEFRDAVKDQLLAQTMQSKITKDITASPADVRAYFDRISSDSLPLINAELEVAQIVCKPPVNEEEKRTVREELQKIRDKIIAGSDFGAMAALYSQDPGSAKNAGELGLIGRGQLVPEFEAVAFSLKKDEVSAIVETSFGYHIIQLIERRGEQINVRHILMKPKVNPADLDHARMFLDSVSLLISKDSISFEEAAQKFSSDIDTKNNGGVMVNPSTGTSKFETDQLDPILFFQIDKLKIRELSSPMVFETPEGGQAYRIVMVRSRTTPHRASIQEDYQRIQAAALTEKQDKVLNEWIKRKRSTTSVQIGKEYEHCISLSGWFAQ